MLPHVFIGLDKRGYQVNVLLISPQNHMLWYSLEAPHLGTFNEYPQHMFSWRNKKNINIITFGLKKASYQEALSASTGAGHSLSAYMPKDAFSAWSAQLSNWS